MCQVNELVPVYVQDITKVMVVVTDGGSRSPGETAREARLAREEGFYMFVVGIGQFLEESEWRSIASDPDSSFIFNITNFNLLDEVKITLPRAVCPLPPITSEESKLSNYSENMSFVNERFWYAHFTHRFNLKFNFMSVNSQ